MELFGYGYWGPNLVRNIAEIADAEVLWLSDPRPERLALAKRRFPAISTITDYREMLRDGRVDALVIATPVHTHFRPGIEVLRANKNAILEKPLTASSEEAERLIETAAARNLRIMVDHTFIYTGAVRKIKSLIGDGTLGAIQRYHSVRINLGLLQPMSACFGIWPSTTSPSWTSSWPPNPRLSLPQGSVTSPIGLKTSPI